MADIVALIVTSLEGNGAFVLCQEHGFIWRETPIIFVKHHEHSNVFFQSLSCKKLTIYFKLFWLYMMLIFFIFMERISSSSANICILVWNLFRVSEKLFTVNGLLKEITSSAKYNTLTYLSNRHLNLELQIYMASHRASATEIWKIIRRPADRKAL